MPLLGSVGHSILDSILNNVEPSLGRMANLNNVVEVLDFNDVTKTVSALTLALGIVFLVATISLYAFYYSTTIDFTKPRITRSIRGEFLDITRNFVKLLINLL